MPLEQVFHSPKSLPETLRKLRAALKPLGLALAFELDCEAMLRSRLHVGLGRSLVLGVHDPLWMLEGYVASASFGLLGPLHVCITERENGTEIQILNAQWLCGAGLPAGTVQPLLRTLQKLERALIEAGARRRPNVPAEISWLTEVRT